MPGHPATVQALAVEGGEPVGCGRRALPAVGKGCSRGQAEAQFEQGSGKLPGVAPLSLGRSA